MDICSKYPACVSKIQFLTIASCSAGISEESNRTTCKRGAGPEEAIPDDEALVESALPATHICHLVIPVWE